MFVFFASFQSFRRESKKKGGKGRMQQKEERDGASARDSSGFFLWRHTSTFYPGRQQRMKPRERASEWENNLGSTKRQAFVYAIRFHSSALHSGFSFWRGQRRCTWPVGCRLLPTSAAVLVAWSPVEENIASELVITAPNIFSLNRLLQRTWVDSVVSKLTSAGLESRRL